MLNACLIKPLMPNLRHTWQKKILKIKKSIFPKHFPHKLFFMSTFTLKLMRTSVLYLLMRTRIRTRIKRMMNRTPTTTAPTMVGISPPSSFRTTSGRRNHQRELTSLRALVTENFIVCVCLYIYIPLQNY